MTQIIRVAKRHRMMREVLLNLQSTKVRRDAVDKLLDDCDIDFTVLEEKGKEQGRVGKGGDASVLGERDIRHMKCGSGEPDKEERITKGRWVTASVAGVGPDPEHGWPASDEVGLLHEINGVALRLRWST